ncbi:HD domain-containing protein [Streptoalloteichus hindustanus]|uniref:Metal dependent phosphohydrolase n=1 Tax=Streptoalloteichus hindustanus TaxID=2017 RepID=A0A1M5GX20_STRHI|nr:HD domain-containing protein [Streptoalloteichus hindustanus]SHG08228.1 metal dependent phosphohydrolase [Streptoalloteichus hindustanus]
MSDPYETFHLPESEISRAAFRFAAEIESPAVFHHSVRSYLFGRELGRARGLEVDDELLFLGCVLHDVGLSEAGDGDQRFEVDGADLAASLLREHGVPEERVEVVWDAIALHTSPGIASRKRPEIALAHAGTGADVLGLHADQLPGDLVERAFAVFPRLDLGRVITDEIVRQAVANPAKAPFASFPAVLLADRGLAPEQPSWDQLVSAVPWRD